MRIACKLMACRCSGIAIGQHSRGMPREHRLCSTYGSRNLWFVSPDSMSDLEGIAGDSSAEDGGSAAGPEHQTGFRTMAPRNQQGQQRGPLRIFLIWAASASVAGLRHRASDFANTPESEDLVARPQPTLCGVVLARAWCFRTLGEQVDEQTALMHELAVDSVSCRTPVAGFIDYPVEGAACLSDFFTASVGTVAPVLLHCADCFCHEMFPRSDTRSDVPSESLQSVLDRWPSQRRLMRSACPVARSGFALRFTFRCVVTEGQQGATSRGRGALCSQVSLGEDRCGQLCGC